MVETIHFLLAMVWAVAFLSLLGSTASILSGRMDEHVSRLEFSILCAGAGVIGSIGLLVYSIVRLFP